jgi:16S rRNA processing protein RimM
MPPDLLEVGRIAKPHGLRGEVIVELWSDFPDRLDPGSELLSDQGTLVVASSRPHQGRFMVAFEGFSSREAAESIIGLVLRAEPREVPDALWIHDLVGCEVLTTDGSSVGYVAAVEANPASDLLVLDDGRLIPLRFLVSHEPGLRVVIDPPEGLLEL